MKFTVQGKEFLTLLQSVSKVINSKNTITILDNFLMRLEGDRLYVTASDSENVITAWIDVLDAEGEGSLCVPAKRLLEVVKEISNQPVTFEVSQNLVVDVKYLNGSFQFMAVDPAPYPAPRPQEADSKTLEIPADVVRKGITATLFACSSDPIRPIMTGICWDFFEDHIVFVSSDTHKLVRYQNDTYAPGCRLTFVLHSKTSAVVNSLLNAETALVKVELDAKSAIFSFDNVQLSCRFIKGVFPKYDRVVVRDNPYEILVERQALLTAVRRVAIFSSKASQLVKFSISTDLMQLASQDLDYSLSADEKVACQYDGKSVAIGFKSDNTMELLSNIPSESVRIQFSDPARPALFLPDEKREGESLIMLQIPLTVID